MKIAIFGMGYVGIVSLACLARDGHSVFGVDIDEDKLNLIKSGKAPIVERGIQELMTASVAMGNIKVTMDASLAIQSCDVAFVCVGTPSLRNGGQDLSAIERVSKDIGSGMKRVTGYPVIVIRSTVEPGTVMNVIRPILEQESGKQVGTDFGLCFQPEFLREGSSIADYDNPPFTVVGGDSERSVDKVRQVFEHSDAEFIATDIGTAELLKYACNSFHALKICFANEIGRVAQSLSVDSREVMSLVCKDTQLNISTTYLRPGFAFGGSCLPKDLRALLHIAKFKDVDVPMLGALLTSNKLHIEHAVNAVLSSGRRKIGMIGLSFKSGTDDLRESPLVALAETFIGKGLELHIYDPEVTLSHLIGANKRYIEEAIPHIASLMVNDCNELVSTCDVLIIGLHGEEIEQSVRENSANGQLVIDLVGNTEAETISGTYQGICW